MSRDFKEEYTKMLASDVPDLWNRIEASLPDKMAAPTEKLSQNMTQTSKTIEFATEPKKTKKKTNKKKINIWVKIGGGIAACLCVMVTGSLFLLNTPSSSSCDMAAPMEFQESALDQTTTAGGTSKDEAAVAMQPEQEEMQKSVVEENGLMADSAAMDTTDGVQENQAYAQEEAVQNEKQSGVEIVVTITKKELIDEQVTYQAIVKDALKSSFTLDSQIELYTEKNSELTMEQDGQYTVTVIDYEENGQDRFEVISIQP